MRICFHIVVLVLILLDCLAGAVTDDFTRYQGILDRKPFGEPQPDSSTASAVVVAQTDSDLFAKTMKMVAIRLNKDGGMRVGFVNKAAGNKSYYLKVGETSSDGIELVDADFKREAALLRKDAQSGWIHMGSSSGKHGDRAAQEASAQELQNASSPEMLEAMDRRRETLAAEGLRKRQAFHEARKASKAEILSVKLALSNRANSEEVNAQLKESQMDAIRKGLHALPIPLTKEMDDQLVAEGVLQPAQGSK